MELEALIILAGLVGGVASSAPFGVINLWITDAVLSKTEHKILWFLVGVILADLAHAAMASWGYHEILQDSGFDQWVGVLGGVFIVAMGVFGLRKPKELTLESPAKKLKKAHEFFLGIMMCGLNPGFLVFWMFVINQLETKLVVDIHGSNLLSFIIGILIGDLIWFLFIIMLARKGRDHVNPLILKLIRAVIAWVFIGLGIFAIYRSFSDTHAAPSQNRPASH